MEASSGLSGVHARRRGQGRDGRDPTTIDGVLGSEWLLTATAEVAKLGGDRQRWPSSKATGWILSVRDRRRGRGRNGRSLGPKHDRRGSSERVAPGDDGRGGRARRRPAGFWVSALTLEAEGKMVRVRDPATTGRVLRSEWFPTATVEAANLGGNWRAFGRER